MTSDEIGAYLAANGIGTLGTNIFEGLLPDTPDACVTIFEYAGSAGIYTFGPGGATAEQPRIQIVARDTTLPAARSKIHSVYTLLDAIAEATLSGVLYHRVQAIQAPFAMPLDLNNRYLWACNFEALKNPS